MLNQVERFLVELREAHPEMVSIFTNGSCYQLFKIMRVIWPDAQALYSPSKGHVYIKIGSGVYDVTGRHLKPPKDLEPLDHRRPDRPHRWLQRARDAYYKKLEKDGWL